MLLIDRTCKSNVVLLFDLTGVATCDLNGVVSNIMQQCTCLLTGKKPIFPIDFTSKLCCPQFTE